MKFPEFLIKLKEKFCKVEITYPDGTRGIFDMEYLGPNKILIDGAINDLTVQHRPGLTVLDMAKKYDYKILVI